MALLQCGFCQAAKSCRTGHMRIYRVQGGRIMGYSAGFGASRTSEPLLVLILLDYITTADFSESAGNSQ